METYVYQCLIARVTIGKRATRNLVNRKDRVAWDPNVYSQEHNVRSGPSHIVRGLHEDKGTSRHWLSSEFDNTLISHDGELTYHVRSKACRCHDGYYSSLSLPQTCQPYHILGVRTPHLLQNQSDCLQYMSVVLVRCT